MPRRARLALAGVSTHLVQRGIDRGACFFRDDDRLHYLALLAELAPALGCAVHAYVLMGNHVHLLVTPSRAESLSRLMRHLNQRYVQAIALPGTVHYRGRSPDYKLSRGVIRAASRVAGGVFR